MTNIDTAYFKNKLHTELTDLEKELESLGRKNPENPGDWEAQERVERSADPNEAADAIEEYEEKTAILKQLEIRYNELKEALKRINEGNYGICEKGGEPIEKERLEANPASRTCKAHM